MENVKKLREKLEKELEELEKVEGEARDEAKIKSLKDVIALSDEDLMAFFEKTSSKEMSEEELDNVAGGSFDDLINYLASMKAKEIADYILANQDKIKEAQNNQ